MGNNNVKPALVIMAAGMGSRYGGLKQIDPVGPNGEIIIDYSIYDAHKAGFEKVICVIKRSMAEDFKEIIGDRLSGRVEIVHAYQDIDDLPEGFSVPEGRTKPWGTTHALLAAKDLIQCPVAVVNADDYYGPNAYRIIYKWLTEEMPDDGKLHYTMAGYLIENTLTDHGSVTRGICKEKDGYLSEIVERTMIERSASGAKFSEDKGQTWTDLPQGTLVSMNAWGLAKGFFDEAAKSFPEFLKENLPDNPLKCEHLLPSEIDRQIQAGLADVRVLQSPDTWHGVTYQEDKPRVVEAIRALHEKGLYPTPLWG